MKVTLNFLTIIFFVFMTSCGKDSQIDYEYHVHIVAPTSTAKVVGDILKIQVDFESHAGLPVHHINVRIYDKATQVEIYNMPTEAHVHATSGTYVHNGEVVLSKAGTYVLEGTVWGESDDDEKVKESLEFLIK